MKTATMKLIAATAAVLLLAGCATTFKPWKLSDIEPGMEKSQIVQILGEPDRSETKDNAEYLYYTYREDLNPNSSSMMSDSNEAIEARVKEVSRTLEDVTYEVIIVDGKLVNYKELPAL